MKTLKYLFAYSQQVVATKLVRSLIEKGDKCFREEKYFAALIAYNKSLCYAAGSAEMSEGFAGRSAVYFETKHFEKCLENIQFAKESFGLCNGVTLMEREDRCKENFVQQEDAWSVFKLSRPPNPRVPLIVNCLSLRENEMFGRFIVTDKNLSPGEIIAIEEPFVKFVDFTTLNHYKHQRCFNCLKTNQLSLIPGPNSVMSCSPACHDALSVRRIDLDAMSHDDVNWKISKLIQLKFEAEAIAGSVEELEKLANEPTRTVFDFDFNSMLSEERNKNLLKCVMSLTAGSNETIFDETGVFKLILGSYSNRQRIFLESFVQSLMNVCKKNQFSLNIFNALTETDVKLGNCLLPFASLINHSCDPNIVWIFVDNKFVYFSAKKIQAGEQLFQCYRSTFMHESLKDRQNHLQSQYGFKCDCSACRKNYPKKQVNTELDYGRFRNQTEVEEEIALNWKRIGEYSEVESPCEVAALVQANKKLLQFLATKFMFC